MSAVLAATADPQAPGDVTVSRPSDVLAARRAANDTLNGLLLGLGAVALLVGGVGVANTMVISVLERRAEIGLRRSLGATRGQIRLAVPRRIAPAVRTGRRRGSTARHRRHHRVRRIPDLANRRTGMGDSRRTRRHPAHRQPRRAVPGDPRRPAVPDRSPDHTLTRLVGVPSSNT